MTSAVENEFKFTTDRKLDEDAAVKELLSFLDNNSIPYRLRTKHSVDRYYDTADLAIYRMDSIVRMKHSSNGKIKLTLKKPISKDDGMMSRKEIERVSDGTFSDICNFAGEVFPDLVLSEEPSIELECSRTSIDYEDGSEIKLSFDHCTYLHGNLRKDFFEIELEFMSDSTATDFDRLGICGFVENHLGFVPTVKSKYQRGIEWIQQTESRKINVTIE